VATAKMKAASSTVALTNTPGPTRFHRTTIIGDD
jgi:hypothetical protein